MLRKVPLRLFSERLFGFTIPDQGIFYACDHDEAFKIDVSAETSVEVLDDSSYPFLESFDNALGALGGKPLLIHEDKTVSYDFDGHDDFVQVRVQRGNEHSVVSFRTLSGDWFAATLSTCGRHLLLAEPYLLECYEFE